MADMLLHAQAVREGALRKRTRSRGCPCCCDYGSTKSGARNRQRARQRARRIERRAWLRLVEADLTNG